MDLAAKAVASPRTFNGFLFILLSFGSSLPCGDGFASLSFFLPAIIAHFKYWRFQPSDENGRFQINSFFMVQQGFSTYARLRPFRVKVDDPPEPVWDVQGIFNITLDIYDVSII